MGAGEAPLVIDPLVVDFGATPLGVSRQAAVTVFNPNRAPARLHAAATTPFEVAPEGATVGGAESAVFTVSFAPPVSGSFASTLTLIDDFGTAAGAAVRGVGFDPGCPASTACSTWRYDDEAGSCRATPAAEGTDCTSSSVCFVRAACRRGECVGSLTTCDDGDACTVDACGTTGCLHVPVSCPIADPCSVAICDSASGCGSVPAEDGTPCGQATCAVAHVCIAGRCEARPTPNAAASCRYVEVVASNGRSCALSRAGVLKCWGWPAWRAVTPPELAGTRSLVGNPYEICGVRDDGGVRCFTGEAPPQDLAFPSAVTQLDTDFTQHCAVLADGRVECTFGSFTAEPGARVALIGAHQAVAVLSDGGLAGRPQPPTLPAVHSLRVIYGFSSCGHTPDGHPVCLAPAGAAATVAGDGGTVVVGGGYGTLCAADLRGVVHCSFREGLVDGGEAWAHALSQELSPPIRELTTRGVDFRPMPGSWSDYGDRHGHVCLIDGNHEVWCMGKNASGQLGDRSAQPQGVQDLPLGQKASGLLLLTPWTRGQSQTVVAGDGGVWLFSIESSRGADAGYPIFIATPNIAAVDVDPPSGDGRFINFSGRVRLLDEHAEVWESDRSLHRFEPVAWRRLGLPGRPSALRGGRALIDGGVWSVTAIPYPLFEGPGLALSSGCVLRPDGGVGCRRWDGQRFEYVHVDLPWPSHDLGRDAHWRAGCTVTQQGTTGCWQSLDAGLTTAIIPGVRPWPRQLVGHVQGGCAVSGRNGVQCWGDNGAGQLGRDGLGFSAAPVDIPFSEAVRAISRSERHACVLLDTGAVKCWGDNHNGQLGTAPLLESARFIKVPY